MTFPSLLFRLFERNSTRLLLAFGSLAIGALTLGTVLGLIGSVQRFFVSESRVLLGGDITIEENTPTDIEQSSSLRNLREEGAIFSRRIDTLVVVQGKSPPIPGRLSSLLVSLKVVDEAYPLYGSLGTSLPGEKIPRENEVFVAPDLLDRMGIVIGDTLTIGKATYTIANGIVSEPDRVAGSFRLGPIALISQSGWERTGIDGRQSRVDHILSIRIPESISQERKEEITEDIRRAFTRSGSRISVAADGPTQLLRILDAGERFFFTMIVLALFLVVVNIRVNLVYFLSSFQKTIAIMRSLGMRRAQIFTAFSLILTLVAITAGILGSVAGNLAANTALPYAELFVGNALPKIGVFENVLIVSSFTLLLCLFSAAGFLSRITAIEPKMLLLGYGAEHGGVRLFTREIPALLLTLLGLYMGLWYLTERAIVAAIAVGSISIFFGLLFFLTRLGIAFGYRTRGKFHFIARSITSFLRHQGIVGTTAITSLTIALASVFAIALIERNVIGNLRTEFREDAPNIYAIDIQEDQLSGVRQIMGPTWEDFSVVRGRFMERDGFSIQENLDTEDGELSREFNLTARGSLIEGERVIDGAWHGDMKANEVSIERDFADRAKLTLGTQVKFLVQGFPVIARVTSIREVNTTNGLPFFFLVFSPDVLRDFPRTSFGYAYVPESQIPIVQNQLASRYPNISSIPTTQILETVGKVVNVLAAAVIATAVPALILGFVLIIAMLALSARERSNDMLVFTAFGARLPLLFSLFIIESVSVIVIATIFAGVISHTGVWVLNRYVFEFRSFYGSWEIVWVTMGILFLTIFIAYLFARRFIASSPAELLRKN